MGVWQTIWVVLMLFWAFFGCWWGYSGVGPDRMGRVGGTFIPFFCVLILGLLYFGAIGGGVVQVIR